MSHVKMWNKYYNHLEKKHKEKYDAYTTSLNKLDTELNKYISERDELIIKLKESELYEEAQTILKVHILTSNERTYDIYKEKMDEAENAIVGFKATNEIINTYYNDINILRNKMSKFRSAVLTVYDEPPLDVIPTTDVEKQCSVCMENLKNMAMPCGHLLCGSCVERVSKCPSCKKGFAQSKIIKIFY